MGAPSILWQNIAGVLTSDGHRALLTVHLRGSSSQYFSFRILRALRADLFGRDYSEAPSVPSDPNLYNIHLALLLLHIRWDRADIINFSIATYSITISQTHI